MLVNLGILIHSFINGNGCGLNNAVNNGVKIDNVSDLARQRQDRQTERQRQTERETETDRQRKRKRERERERPVGGRGWCPCD